MKDSTPVLVTGATGYVGGRLVPLLLDSGYVVKAMGRSLEKMSCRPWGRHPNVRLVEGDVLDLKAMKKAAEGCRAAFYLVHSMISGRKKFAEADRTGAKNMVAAAEAAGMKKIIYLGGLGDITNHQISKHLKSRHEVAVILQSGSVPATHLRAAMILGSGSASFEILRYLVDRLPVMITPRWVQTPCQPIAIANVLNYLKGCLENDETDGGTFDICGPEVYNYRELINLYAEIAGLSKRIIIPVPVLTPGLSAKWIHLVTPIPASIAVPLTEGLSVPVICTDNRIRELVPQRLYTCRDTIRRAMNRIHQELVETCWSDAGEMIPPEWTHCGDADYAGGTILECGFEVRIQAAPEQVWEAVSRIGGENGWYFADALWRIRGMIDKLVGGVGLRRGRRHPTRIRVGDALDFFRVLETDPPNRLVLIAEMKIPGEALAEFTIEPLGPDQTELRLLSRFLPLGLAGIIYWYSLLLFHEYIFFGMLKSMAGSLGKPVTHGPSRITPRLKDTCSIFPKR